MTELVLHAADRMDATRVLCGQIKRRTGSRRQGLRFTYANDDVTCEKCLRRFVVQGTLSPPAAEERILQGRLFECR